MEGASKVGLIGGNKSLALVTPLGDGTLGARGGFAYVGESSSHERVA